MVAGNNIDLSKPPFEKALRLFPRVADCNEFNEGELMKLSSNTPIFEFEADHVLLENRRSTYGAVSYEKVKEELIPEDDKECGRLPRVGQFTKVCVPMDNRRQWPLNSLGVKAAFGRLHP